MTAALARDEVAVNPCIELYWTSRGWNA